MSRETLFRVLPYSFFLLLMYASLCYVNERVVFCSKKEIDCLCEDDAGASSLGKALDRRGRSSRHRRRRSLPRLIRLVRPLRFKEEEREQHQQEKKERRDKDLEAAREKRDKAAEELRRALYDAKGAAEKASAAAKAPATTTSTKLPPIPETALVKAIPFYVPAFTRFKEVAVGRVAMLAMAATLALEIVRAAAKKKKKACWRPKQASDGGNVH
jgi:hypothetical protein